MTRIAVSMLVIVLILTTGARPARSQYLLAAFGDSITISTTATVICKFVVMTPVYACPNGNDYLSVAARLLDASEPTAYQNLAFRGASTVSVPLYQVPFLSPAANVVVLFIGSGDRLRVADAAGYSLEEWKQDYTWAVSAIRERAPKDV